MQSRPELARANVLGVGVHAINMESAVSTIQSTIAQNRKGYVCVTSVHGVMEAKRDPELAKALDGALLVTPDGTPTVWVGRLQGFRNMRRVFGPELMLAVCESGVPLQTTHFLCGGMPGVADELKIALEARFPGICIVGTHTPPQYPFSAADRERVCTAINRASPDIVWLGLSEPKQDRLMAELLSSVDARVMIGVGAAFDFHTGRISDSPRWVKNAGLQWLHRLIQEPSRLWRRYLLNNPSFVFRIALQFAGLRTYSLNHYPDVFAQRS